VDIFSEDDRTVFVRDGLSVRSRLREHRHDCQVRFINDLHPRPAVRPKSPDIAVNAGRMDPPIGGHINGEPTSGSEGNRRPALRAEVTVRSNEGYQRQELK
jgi:hypothetical protein